MEFEMTIDFQSDVEKAADGGGFACITMSRGKYQTLVDRDVFEKYREWSWTVTYANKERTHPYCVLRSKAKQNRPLRTRIRIHRAIIGAKSGEIVDHINGDTLDNRRVNLRITTPTANAHNVTKLRDSKTSRYLGVCWSKKYSAWTAQIKISGTQVNLGYFDSEHIAAAARDEKVIETRDALATTNFPREIIQWARERGFAEACELLRSDAARDTHMRAKKREAFWPSDWAFWLGEKSKEMGK